MNAPANVTSVDAIREFRAALLKFEHEMRDTMAELLMESRKAIEWIEHDRPQYWPAQARSASDALAVAANDLERCELAIRPDDKRGCHEQKMAVEASKRRLRFCEQQVEVVRKWRRTLQHDLNEFQGNVTRITDFVDADLPRAVAMLDRILGALDRYTHHDSTLEAAAESRAASMSGPRDEHRANREPASSPGLPPSLNQPPARES